MAVTLPLSTPAADFEVMMVDRQYAMRTSAQLRSQNLVAGG